MPNLFAPNVSNNFGGNPNDNQAMYKIIGADGKEYGPIDAAQLRQWLAEGRVNGQTQILAAGAPSLRSLSAFPEFFAPFSAGVPLPFSSAQYGSANVPRTNGMAITGMILGIVSITLGLCCCYGLPFSVPGVVFSLVGLSQLKNNPHQQGRGMAIAGIILCALSLLLALVLGIVFGLSGVLQEIMRDAR